MEVTGRELGGLASPAVRFCRQLPVLCLAVKSQLDVQHLHTSIGTVVTRSLAACESLVAKQSRSVIFKRYDSFINAIISLQEGRAEHSSLTGGVALCNRKLVLPSKHTAFLRRAGSEWKGFFWSFKLCVSGDLFFPMKWV